MKSMIRALLIVLIVFMAVGNTNAQVASPVIQVEYRNAGAITSLTWNGKQFVDSHDKGRLIQFAAFLNLAGECLNPTEAGAGVNPPNTTSSVLLDFRAGNEFIYTKINPAFWLTPSQAASTCGSTPHNTTTTWAGTFEKTISWSGQVFTFDEKVTAPASLTSMVAETTGYLAGDMTNSWAYDPIRNLISPIVRYQTTSITWAVFKEAYSFLPVIMSTPDGAYAMGVYQPPISGFNSGNADYRVYSFQNFTDGQPDSVKWSSDRVLGGSPAGSYSFRTYFVVGTLADVQGLLAGLASTYPPFQKITRAGAAADMVTHFGIATANPGTPSFSDVPATSPDYQLIEGIKSAGITSGCGSGKFCPHDYTLRIAAAAFLIRASGIGTNPADTTQRFSDVPSSNPLFAYVQRLGELSIVTGSTFNPNGDISLSDWNAWVDALD